MDGNIGGRGELSFEDWEVPAMTGIGRGGARGGRTMIFRSATRQYYKRGRGYPYLNANKAAEGILNY